ncbi:MAG TPA: SRPBCC family protein [Gaiellaceae bacterium]|nr:SRPBCC family protein [Gaiellaceae bacterium]
MAENEVVIDADRERVFAVLADGPRYHQWVMGAADVRAADDAWPAPGSRIHHSTGVGKLTIDDSTEVVACDPPKRLELLAHLGPLGSFRVEFTLDALAGGRTSVRMVEAPVEGVSKLAGPVGDAVGKLRNMLSLARLKEIAER